MVFRIVLVCCCFLCLFSGTAREVASVRLSWDQRAAVFRQVRTFVLPVSQEQLQLEEQLREIARRHSAYDDFEKEVRRKFKLPADPVEECTLFEDLKARQRGEEDLQEVVKLFSDAMSRWFAKGYFAARTQMFPVRLFLRQFYDDHKNSSSQARYDIELSARSDENEDKGPVKITADGEGFTENEAIRAAIKEALGRFNVYWSNKIESSTFAEGKEITSKLEEKTIIIYGANLKSYNVLSSMKTPEGKYNVTIAAVIEKSSGSHPLNIKSISLADAWTRYENRKNAAKLLGEVLEIVPITLNEDESKGDDLFTIEENMITVNCVLRVNPRAYQRYLEQIKQILGKVSVAENSFAANRRQLAKFLANKVSPDGSEKSFLVIRDFKDNIPLVRNMVPIQHADLPETVYYRKYQLNKLLAQKIREAFAVKPEIVFELIDSEGNPVSKTVLGFDKLGISFLSSEVHHLPVLEDGELTHLPWKGMLISPFFYCHSRKISSTEIRFPVTLHLSPELFRQKPDLKVYLQISSAARRKPSQRLTAPKSVSNLDEAVFHYRHGNFSEAFRQFMPPARKGDPLAVHYIGLLYWNWKKDAAQAIEWLSRNDEADSLVQLGDIHLAQNNLQEARDAYRKAAEKGNSRAQGRYGKLILKEQPGEGIRYLRKSAAAGNRSACYHAAEYYRQNNQWKEAFSFYRQAWNQARSSFKQYSQCAYYLGYCYAYGYGIKEDSVEALFYLDKVPYLSDKYGDAQYLSGIIQKDAGQRKEALDHFKQGAQVKHSASMFQYGIMMLPINENEAWKYLSSAIDIQPDRAYDAGLILLKRGTVHKAAEMFKLCALRGSRKRAMAQFQLGKICESLQYAGCPQAIRYYKNAAESNLPQALHALGMIAWRSGKYGDCHTLLKKAAGYPPADLAHGKLHEDRLFGGFSRKEALFWYTKAYNGGKLQKEFTVAREAEANIKRLKSFKH